MIAKVLINGQASHSIDVLDRGFQYGDGLFETILVEKGCATFLNQHLKRLRKGCAVLGFPMLDETPIRHEISTLLKSKPSGVLKLIVTRGVGERGFLAPTEPLITRVISFSEQAIFIHDALSYCSLIHCQTRLSRQPILAGIKHLNQLERVLARTELADQVGEGLMLDVSGKVIEGVMSNLFMVKAGCLITPSLDHSGVAGVIRGFLIEQAKQQGIACQVKDLTLLELEEADEIFITNSLMPVRAINTLLTPTGSITKSSTEFAQWALTTVVDEVDQQFLRSAV